MNLQALSPEELESRLYAQGDQPLALTLAQDVIDADDYIDEAREEADELEEENDRLETALREKDEAINEALEKLDNIDEQLEIAELEHAYKILHEALT